MYWPQIARARIIPSRRGGRPGRFPPLPGRHMAHLIRGEDSVLGAAATLAGRLWAVDPSLNVCVFCCSGLSCFMWGIGMRDRYSRCLVCFWMMENKSIPALKKYFSSNQYSPRWTTCPFLSVRLYCVLWKTMSEIFYFSVGNGLRASPRDSLYLP